MTKKPIPGRASFRLAAVILAAVVLAIAVPAAQSQENGPLSMQAKATDLDADARENAGSKGSVVFDELGSIQAERVETTTKGGRTRIVMHRAVIPGNAGITVEQLKFEVGGETDSASSIDLVEATGVQARALLDGGVGAGRSPLGMKTGLAIDALSMRGPEPGMLRSPRDALEGLRSALEERRRMSFLATGLVVIDEAGEALLSAETAMGMAENGVLTIGIRGGQASPELLPQGLPQGLARRGLHAANMQMFPLNGILVVEYLEDRAVIRKAHAVSDDFFKISAAGQVARGTGDGSGGPDLRLKVRLEDAGGLDLVVGNADRRKGLARMVDAVVGGIANAFQPSTADVITRLVSDAMAWMKDGGALEATVTADHRRDLEKAAEAPGIRGKIEAVIAGARIETRREPTAPATADEES